MPARNRQERKPRSPSLAETMRAHGVILEDIRSQMAVVVESVTSTRTELKADIAALDRKLSERISVLEEVVRQNSKDIRKNSDDIRKNSDDICKNSEDIRKNSQDIRALREEVARLRHDFDHREERGRVGALEARVAAIEAHLGIAPR